MCTIIVLNQMNRTYPLIIAANRMSFTLDRRGLHFYCLVTPVFAGQDLEKADVVGRDAVRSRLWVGESANKSTSARCTVTRRNYTSTLSSKPRRSATLSGWTHTR